MTFTHRPQNGISVGFAVIAGVAYMSVGFVRDGDCFNRKLARRILAQRIESSLSRTVKMVVATPVPANVDARGIVREFRKVFKPDPLCEDNTFSTSFVDEANLTKIVYREPMSRDQSYAKISDMFANAVKAAATTCVS
jgi:hypothetical protein